MFRLESLNALEILDSRGRPTVQVTCHLLGGASATASVPSGASTGRAEAVELRDGDPKRYRGMGCQRAVVHVRETINKALAEREFSTQAELDGALLELDGTENKSRFGANALLGVSVAFARATARARGVQLYEQFASMTDGGLTRRLPQLTINLFSGGKHAGVQAPIQDVLVVPVAARTVEEALAMTFDVYQAAAELIRVKYGMRLLRADEGGLAPDFTDAESMLADAVESIRLAGYEPGAQVGLAVDVASSHFHRDSIYHLGSEALDSPAMIKRLVRWTRDYFILSVEDGLAEEDWRHWPALVHEIGDRVMVLGDDFLCTNPGRIRRAIDARAANALLLKVNQVGTLTEAAEALRLARSAGWRVTISARSGETEDNWLADLAVGWGGDQIKIGSITQSDRLSKYNRLLAIEAEGQVPGWNA
jgi:enolase